MGFRVGFIELFEVFAVVVVDPIVEPFFDFFAALADFDFEDDPHFDALPPLLLDLPPLPAEEPPLILFEEQIGFGVGLLTGFFVGFLAGTLVGFLGCFTGALVGTFFIIIFIIDRVGGRLWKLIELLGFELKLGDADGRRLLLGIEEG